MAETEPSFSTVKMSLQFYEPYLQAAFDEYLETRQCQRNKFFNEVFEIVLSLRKVFDPDTVDNLKAVCAVINAIDWEDVASLHQSFQNQPLTRNITKADLIVALVMEGSNSFQSKANRQ